MVKAIGSKPISLWERRFEPYQLWKFVFLQMYGHIEGSHWPHNGITISSIDILTSSCGRVVKAISSKLISLWERRFEPYQLRKKKFVFLQMYRHIEGSHWPFAMELQYLHFIYSQAVVAEWLRRLARNQVPSGSVDSNLTNCGSSFFSKCTDI